MSTFPRRRGPALPLAMSTGQWRFMDEKREDTGMAGVDKPMQKLKLPNEITSGMPGGVRLRRSVVYELSEELADDTLPKETILEMLESVVGGEDASPEGTSNAASPSPSAASPPPAQHQAPRDSGERTSKGTPSPSHGKPGPAGAAASSDNVNPSRVTRRVRHDARRSSVKGRSGQYRSKRRSTVIMPRTVPLLPDEADAASDRDDDFWGVNDLDMESLPSPSPPRAHGHGRSGPPGAGPPHPHGGTHKHGHGRSRSTSPQKGSPDGHGGVGKGKSKKDKEHSPLRPQSPVIIWRPNAAVRLASDLPRECLSQSILQPRQGQKIADMVKFGRFYEATSAPERDDERMPDEMRRLFSYYKQFVSNTKPTADEEKEVLSGSYRPEWGKRIPPTPKREYGAWYIPPEMWDHDMKKNRSAKGGRSGSRSVDAMGGMIGMGSLSLGGRLSGDKGRKGSTMEDDLTELEIHEANIRDQIPNQFSSKMYKEYIRKKGGRLPHYLDRVQSPPPMTKGNAQAVSPRGREHVLISAHMYGRG